MKGWNLPKRIANDWIGACQSIATSRKLFRSFRRIPIITYMTETRHKEEVLPLWRKACAIDDSIPRLLPIFSRRDMMGDPAPCDIDTINGFKLSGTTAYSIFRVAQMRQLFGSGPFHVAEIGGGYGNMANVMFTVGMVASYTGFDLESPSRLQARYLSEQGWMRTNWPTLQKPARAKFDLCVSSYSLSELTVEALTMYSEILLRYSTRGFHAWNWDRECFRGQKMVERDLITLNNLLHPHKVEQRWDDVYVWGNK